MNRGAKLHAAHGVMWSELLAGVTDGDARSGVSDAHTREPSPEICGVSKRCVARGYATGAGQGRIDQRSYGPGRKS